MPSDTSYNPFWEYSVDLWRHSELRCALLELQDSLVIDINLALFCVWSAGQGSSVRDSSRQCGEISNHWQNRYLKPLRGLRGKSSEDGIPDLKPQLLEAELLCERLEQHALYALHSQLKPSNEAAMALAKDNLESVGYAEVFSLIPENIMKQML